VPVTSRLLQRQLRSHFRGGEPPPGLEGLLEAVDESYRRFETGRALLERSLELSSDELLSANAELRGMLQALPDLFITLDADGRILSYRPPACPGAMKTFSPDDVVGRSIVDIAPAAMQARFREAIGRMRAGSAQEQLDYAITFEEEERHRDARFVRLPEGHALCIIRDVTDLRRAEEALRRSEEHYRLLFDANPQPMWVFDRESFAFLAVNQATIDHYGWSREEFLAMTAVDIRPPEEVQALLELMGRLADAPMRPGVFRHRKRDGTLIDVETLGNPLCFYGRPAVMVLANDVTERRRLEEQFRQTQRMEAVGQLAGGVAHDFNNLLTVITGYCELLFHSLADRAPDLRRVHEVHRAAARAASLTRQLLAFSRKQVLELRVLDLNEVVQGMAPMLSRLLGEHVHLNAPRTPHLGHVKADPGQIEQIVMNLAINARDAMPDGGALTIELADVELDAAPRGIDAALRSGPHVTLAVNDTGCGMDAATRARIFEPFFTTKEIGKGTGLGLATVYGIVQQSDGAIQVESEPGRGATFRIYLPRVEPVAAAGEVAEAPAKSASGRETVLVVEDEKVVRALEAEILAGHGYNVLIAGDAQEALAIEERCEETIALLVTDVVMPGRSGRELAQEFVRRRPGTRVLYVSGYANDAFVGGGLLDAGTSFLQKPFTPEALAHKVRDVLDTDRPALAA
jgi:two-component system, cell cycle sensor histidine kinase and response regulator CckA